MKILNNEKFKEILKRNNILFTENFNSIQILDKNDMIEISIDYDFDIIDLKNINATNNSIILKSNVCSTCRVEEVNIENSKIDSIYFFNIENIKTITLDNVDLKSFGVSKAKKLKNFRMFNMTPSLFQLDLKKAKLNKRSVKNILKYIAQIKYLSIENMSSIRFLVDQKGPILSSDYKYLKFFKKEKGHLCFLNSYKASIYDWDIDLDCQNLFHRNTYTDEAIEKYFNEIEANKLMKSVFFKGATLTVKSMDNQLFKKYLNEEDKIGNRLATYCKTTEDLDVIFKEGYLLKEEDFNYLRDQHLKNFYEKHYLLSKTKLENQSENKKVKISNLK